MPAAAYSAPAAPARQGHRPLRAADFVRRTGPLVQVELEALDPDDLLGLYEAVLSGLKSTGDRSGAARLAIAAVLGLIGILAVVRDHTRQTTRGMT